MKKRPISVTIIAILFIVVGVVSLAAHLSDFDPRAPFPSDLVWASLVSVIAVIAGIWMLRGYDWARWLALLWMAFHVALSYFDPLRTLIIHGIFLIVLVYFLFRRPAREYFRPTRATAA